MAFDAHAADFGLVLADYFQNALDQKHPSLRHFKLGPVYFLDDQDPVFLALLDKLRDLLSSESVRRSGAVVSIKIWCARTSRHSGGGGSRYRQHSRMTAPGDGEPSKVCKRERPGVASGAAALLA
jgi:hypothetical protein